MLLELSKSWAIPNRHEFNLGISEKKKGRESNELVAVRVAYASNFYKLYSRNRLRFQAELDVVTPESIGRGRIPCENAKLHTECAWRHYPSRCGRVLGWCNRFHRWRRFKEHCRPLAAERGEAKPFKERSLAGDGKQFSYRSFTSSLDATPNEPRSQTSVLEIRMNS